MANINKLDMTDIWASGGDKVAPDPSKIAQGWIVEAVPRQTWNWFENRQDQNIAYLLQKGFPEWDEFTEYQANKSWVNRGGTIYRALQTAVNQNPDTASAHWTKAFPESSASLEALRGVTPAANTLPYFTSGTAAAVTGFTAFARTLLDDADAVTARTTLSAQLAHANLTALSGVTAGINVLPYFDSSSTMSGTGLSGFARTLLDDVDAAAARTTLGVPSSTDAAFALSEGLATKQPLSATLTAHAGVTTAANTFSYWTGVNAASVTALTAFARTLLDDVDAATARATLSVLSVADAATNLTTGLATRQPLSSLLTNYANQSPTSNTMIYYVGVGTAAITTLTAFGRSILDDPDAITMRATIGANDAANLTTGLLDLARIPTNLTGKNASSATALQTARTIQGVPFDGTANINLPVVTRDTVTGAANMPAGTTANRPVTPTDGMMRYNSDTKEFEGYQNGGWAGIGGGNPLFTVLWWPTRSVIPAGYVPADGQLLTRTTYQAAWAQLQNPIGLLTSETIWQSSATYRGFYSSGDGSTNFRVPDMNGKVAGSAGAVFLRGDGALSTGVPGNIQQDAFQDHTHFSFSDTSTFRSGGTVGGTGTASFALVGAGGLQGSLTSGAAPGYGYRLSNETRPLNITGVWIIKLLGGATAASQEDASIAVAALEVKYSRLSGRNRIINGDMLVQQRLAAGDTNAGPAVHGGPDRYLLAYAGVPGGRLTQTAGSFTWNNTVRRSVRQTATIVSSNITGSAGFIGIAQLIEGFNCYDLVGQPVAISFLFNTNVSGTYPVSLRDGTASTSYVTTFTAVAGVPQRVVVLVPPVPNTATVPSSNATGMSVLIGACNTGTFQTATPNSWLNANYWTATGTTNWTATLNGFIEVSELQVEAGTSATEFERVSVQQTINLCQRYYRVQDVSSAAYQSASAGFGQHVSHPVPMRASPTVVWTTGSVANCTNPGVTASSTGWQHTGYATATGSAFMTGQATFSAEL